MRHILSQLIRIGILCGILSALPPPALLGQSAPGQPPRPHIDTISQFQQIVERMKADDYRGVISLVEEYYQTRSVTEENLVFLLIQGSAHQRLNELARAIASYERSLPIVRKMNNVVRRKYASVFFGLGELYGQKGVNNKAISFIEEGLSLEPQNTYYQIVLGEHFNQSGQKARAVSHYRD